MSDADDKGYARFYLAAPLILVNAVAVFGQFSYLQDHLNWPLPGIIVFAAALESIALYLAYMAHLSLISLDSSIRLRLGALTFGIIAGYMNATHYEHDGRLTFISVATGLMSASSPVLWGIYSRRISRDVLMSKGLIEPGAVRLGVNRWLWHFSTAFAVYRFAAWEGIREPGAAIAAYNEREPAEIVATVIPDSAVTDAEVIPDPAAIEAPHSAPEPVNSSDTAAALPAGLSRAAYIGLAIAALGESASGPDIAAWLAQRGHDVATSYVRAVKSRRSASAAATQRDNIRALPSPDGHTG
jgi:hypothetical protein